MRNILDKLAFAGVIGLVISLPIIIVSLAIVGIILLF